MYVKAIIEPQSFVFTAILLSISTWKVLYNTKYISIVLLANYQLFYTNNPYFIWLLIFCCQNVVTDYDEIIVVLVTLAKP